MDYFAIHSITLHNGSEERALLRTSSPVGGLASVGDVVFFSDDRY